MAQLTTEELQSIKDLQTRYNQTVFELGAAEAQAIQYFQRIETLNEGKKGLIADLKTIEQSEAELVKSLDEKYGVGNINIETGEITPLQ